MPARHPGGQHSVAEGWRRLWTALALPAAAAGALRAAYAGWRGDRGPWGATVARSLQRRRKPVRHPVRRTRIYFAGMAVLRAIGAVLAATAI